MELVLLGTSIAFCIRCYTKSKINDKTIEKSGKLTIKQISLLIILGLGKTFLSFGVINILVNISYNHFPALVDNYFNNKNYIPENNGILLELMTVRLYPVLEELIFI